MTNSTSLSNYLNPELISVQTSVSSGKKLLEKMANMLSKPLANAKPKDIYHGLLEREKLGNTGIGNGVAIPHSRSSLANNAIVALITLDEPIDFDSSDRQPVDVAFGLLVPAEATSQHLNLLASIAKLMSDPDKKQQLSKAENNEQVVQLITQWSTNTE